MGGKKDTTTKKDKFIMYVGTMTALGLLGFAAPPVLTRMRMQEPAIAHRFGNIRYGNALGMTNKYGSMQSWMKYKSTICQKAMKLANPDMMAMAMMAASLLLTKAIQNMPDSVLKSMGLPVSIKELGVGGAIIGCQAWNPCKQHAMIRCVQYDMIAGGGLGCIGLVVFGSLAHLAAVVQMGNEKAIKKKKKRKAVQDIVMYLGMASFLLHVMGIGGWIGLTAFAIGSLRDDSYYPFPFMIGAGNGFAFLCFISFINALLMICRHEKYKAKKEKEDDGEEDEADMNWMLGKGKGGFGKGKGFGGEMPMGKGLGGEMPMGKGFGGEMPMGKGCGGEMPMGKGFGKGMGKGGPPGF